MKRLAALSVLALTLACANDAGPIRTFPNSDVELAVGNGARFGCTCLFVMEMPEDFCRAWIKASPDLALVSIDYGAKSVQSSAFISWSAKAHYVDAKRGCVLE